MVTPLAQPDDVRGEINVGLSDSEIQFYIDDAAFENDRVNTVADMSDELRIRIERKVAAVKILERKEREATEESVGPTSFSYEVSTIERLKDEVSELDPSNELYEDADVGGSYEVF